MTKVERGAMQRSGFLVDNIWVDQGTAPVAAAAMAAAPAPILSVSIQCPSGSPEAIFVGNQHGQYREIAAGGTQTLEVMELSDVYVRSAAGTGTYNFIAGV